MRMRIRRPSRKLVRDGLDRARAAIILTDTRLRRSIPPLPHRIVHPDVSGNEDPVADNRKAALLTLAVVADVLHVADKGLQRGAL